LQKFVRSILLKRINSIGAIAINFTASEIFMSSNFNSPEGMPNSRREVTPIKLVMKGVGGNLALASIVTMTLIFGMVLALILAIVFILQSENPTSGLATSIAITLVFNIAVFFLSPWLMDLTQRWLYNTRWVSLAEIERQSPATASVIRQVCAQKKIKQPRLGIIDDQNPTALLTVPSLIAPVLSSAKDYLPISMMTKLLLSTPMN
jgi:hypothetical protein